MALHEECLQALQDGLGSVWALCCSRAGEWIVLLLGRKGQGKQWASPHSHGYLQQLLLS